MTSATYWKHLPGTLPDSSRSDSHKLHVFWKDGARQGWPPNRAGYIFLGNAVEEVGQHLFGEGWTGDEFTTAIPTDPASIPDDMTKLQTSQLVHLVLSALRPDVKIPAFSVLRSARPGIPTTVQPHRPGVAPQPAILLTDEHRQIAVEAARQACEVAWPKLDRRFAVERWIADRCAEPGSLVSVYRSYGNYTPIPFEHWNFEGWGHRFIRCTYDPSRPWFLPAEGSGHPIFLTRLSLDVALGDKEDASGEPELWVPERLVAAKQWVPRPEVIAAAKARLRVNGATNPSKKVIASELATMWGKYRDKVSERTIETYLAGVEV